MPQPNQDIGGITAPPPPADAGPPAPPARPSGGRTTYPQPNYTSAQHPAASSTPVDHTWDGVPSGYQSELEDLALQWQQIAGFGVQIDQATLRKMADANVVSLRDMGQWMWISGPMPNALKQRSPWLAFGMDQSTFQRQLSDYQDTIEQVTGQRVQWDPNLMITDPAGMSEWLSGAFVRNQTQAGLREQLLHDQSIQDAYGWVKFGLDFDTFQQRKVDMSMSFGANLSDQQAVLQLQYLRQSQGSGRAVTPTAPQGQSQGPATPSEVTTR